MKSKRLVLALTLALTMLTAVTPVYATDTELTSSGHANTNFKISKASEFKVSIPKTVTINKPTSTSFTYSIKVKGELADDKELTVVPAIPDGGIKLVSSGGRSDIDMDVSLDTMSWDYNSIPALNCAEGADVVNGSLAVHDSTIDAIPSGTWTTTVTFNVDLEDALAGFYASDGTRIIKWKKAGFADVCDSNVATYVKANSDITKVIISDSVTSIGYSAFEDCKTLTSINIPDSVIIIGGRAFNNCKALTSITIPDSVTTIGQSSFVGCPITTITIPDSVTTIDTSAFLGCPITSITIPNSVTTIGANAFSMCPITSINIPNSVTTIDNSTFFWCTSLTSITIPDSVTKIGETAFKQCTKLTSITIPDSVTSIGKNAFDSCESLASVTYKGVEYTSKSALETALTSNGVTVGSDVFNLTKLSD